MVQDVNPSFIPSVTPNLEDDHFLFFYLGIIISLKKSF